MLCGLCTSGCQKTRKWKRKTKHKEQIIPRMLEDLKRSGNDNFIESAERLLIKSEDNYSKELDDIQSSIKYPYAEVVACYELGNIGSEKHIEVLFGVFL